MTFNPNEHISKLGKKDYLEVKWRLCWFRDTHPHGEITTELLQLDLERKIAVFKAIVIDGEGGIASGHGSESEKDFSDYIEKAETKAIGRALAALGYGTQFAPELEEGDRIVDSPVDRSNGQTVQEGLASSPPSDGQLDLIGKLCQQIGKGKKVQRPVSYGQAENLIRDLQAEVKRNAAPLNGTRPVKRDAVTGVPMR